MHSYARVPYEFAPSVASHGCKSAVIFSTHFLLKALIVHKKAKSCASLVNYERSANYFSFFASRNPSCLRKLLKGTSNSTVHAKVLSQFTNLPNIEVS